MFRSRSHQPRRGASAVEFAILSPLIFMAIFGVLEYSRFLFMKNLMENAVREAARVGAVRTNDYTTTQVEDVIKFHMSGLYYSTFDSPVIQIYCANTGSADISQMGQYWNFQDASNPNPNDIPGIGGALAGSPTAAPFYNAGFGQGVRVRMTANFKPVLPTFLLMNATIPMEATSIMLSEAN